MKSCSVRGKLYRAQRQHLLAEFRATRDIQAAAPAPVPSRTCPSLHPPPCPWRQRSMAVARWVVNMAAWSASTLVFLGSSRSPHLQNRRGRLGDDTAGLQDLDSLLQHLFLLLPVFCQHSAWGLPRFLPVFGSDGSARAGLSAGSDPAWRSPLWTPPVPQRENCPTSST